MRCDYDVMLFQLGGYSELCTIMCLARQTISVSRRVTRWKSLGLSMCSFVF